MEEKTEGPQAKKIKDLLEKYASFTLMPMEDKTRVIRLCGILAYLEIAESQQMTIKSCIKGITNFLDKKRSAYVKDEENDSNVVIEP